VLPQGSQVRKSFWLGRGFDPPPPPLPKVLLSLLPFASPRTPDGGLKVPGFAQVLAPNFFRTGYEGENLQCPSIPETRLVYARRSGNGPQAKLARPVGVERANHQLY